MIEPVQSGNRLLADIAAARPAPGQAMIWWLGQSGYAIKTASAIFYVDLYLSEHLTRKYADTEKPHIRMTTAPLHGADLKDLVWLFASHKHSDHLDPGTVPQIMAASEAAKLILPQAVVDHALAMGVDRSRLMPTHGAEVFQIGPITVHSIPSAHPGLDYSEANGYPFLGYIFEVDGVTLYHSGDSLAYEGLAERLRPFSIDLAFLPINGASERLKQLEVPPNMNADEAIRLARGAGIRHMIPCHYDMFTFNTANVHDFEHLARAARQPFSVLHCGERFCWQP